MIEFFSTWTQQQALPSHLPKRTIVRYIWILLFCTLGVALIKLSHIYHSTSIMQKAQDKVDEQVNSYTTTKLSDPMYHPLYGAGREKLRFDDGAKYLIINENGRGYNNYIAGVVRGIMIARHLGRIPLIRKIFVNEHLFPIEAYWSKLPTPDETMEIKLATNAQFIIYNQTTLLPHMMHNVYPVRNNVSVEDYQSRFITMNYQSVYQSRVYVEYIEDYIQDLPNYNITAVVALRHIDFTAAYRSFLQFHKEPILSLHNAFYLGMELQRLMPSIVNYRDEFLEQTKLILKQQLNVDPFNYVAIHMRLGDFLVREYSKHDTFSIRNITESLEVIQEHLKVPVLIITNDPNDPDINFEMKNSKRKYPWYLTSNLKFNDTSPQFRVFFDMLVVHYSQVFVRNPHSTLGLNAIVGRYSDPETNSKRIALFSHRDLINRPKRDLLRGVIKQLRQIRVDSSLPPFKHYFNHK